MKNKQKGGIGMVEVLGGWGVRQVKLSVVNLGIRALEVNQCGPRGWKKVSLAGCALITRAEA